VNPPEAAFCAGCGRPTGDAADERERARTTQERGSYLDRATSRSAIDGERRHVTVMFADLRGSLGVIEGSDPEQVQALLDAVVSRMVDSVERYGGTVNQVMGDGIMALFGAPVAHEDHVVRAANAALQMQLAVRDLHDPAWEALAITPQIRIGMDSGEVLVRTARTELGLEYRALGTTTHMAARMEQLAQPGSVLLTGETLRLGRGMLRTRSVGEQRIKGASEPVEVHELLGMTGRTRFQGNLALGVSPLVGRDESLQVLRHALERAPAEGMRAVVVSGEPGVGKSRLCYEALQEGAGSRYRVLEAAALSYGRSRPHGVLSTLLKELLEVDAGDSAELLADMVEAAAASLGDDGSVSHASAMRALLDLPIDDPGWRRLDPSQRKRGVERTMRTLLDMEFGRGPTVLLLEDLHWADDDTVAFVTGLLSAGGSAPTVVLLTHRPDLQVEWDGLPHVDTCRLQGLPAEAAARLLDSLLGECDAPARVDALVRQTQGNPFFIEESARALREDGGAAQEGSRVEMPATIEALLAARVDRLPPGPVELLQAAAVCGDETPAEVLRRVADLHEPDFRQRVDLLTDKDLLFETRAFRASVYSFKHALIGDAVYHRLLTPRLRALHERAADAIEALFPERLGEYVERLAEHTHRAGLWERALAYYEMASTRALRASASSQAWEHLSKALEIVEQLPGGRARTERAIDLRLRAMAPLVPLGAHTRTLELLEEAEALATELGDAARLTTIHAQQGMTLWLLAENRRAQEVARRAHEEARALGDPRTELATRYYQGVIHHALGELEPAMEILRQLDSDLSGDLARQRMGWAGYPACFVATFCGAALSLLGGFEEATEILSRAAALGEELDHPYSRTMVLEELGFLQLMMGEPQAARRTLELAMEICREHDVLVMHAPIAARLGRALVETGASREGRAVIEDALERETYRAAAHYGIDYLLVAHAFAQLQAGEVDAALATSERAVEEATHHDERAYRVCALQQRADVLGAAGPEMAEDALAAYDETLEAARALGMRPFEALSRQGRSGVLVRAGQHARAEEDRLAALRIWRQLGAPARVAALQQVSIVPQAQPDGA
jgi:class 3 adenylate cyclase/tetratricopeptide (TPR) repeat protein